MQIAINYILTIMYSLKTKESEEEKERVRLSQTYLSAMIVLNCSGR